MKVTHIVARMYTRSIISTEIVYAVDVTWNRTVYPGRIISASCTYEFPISVTGTYTLFRCLAFT